VITETHAAKIRESECLADEVPENGPSRTIINEIDGTMVPVRLQPVDGAEKKRVCRYKEARLSLAHGEGAKQPVFGATLGDPQEAGKHMLNHALA
jgi:hypothetical protein